MSLSVAFYDVILNLFECYALYAKPSFVQSQVLEWVEALKGTRDNR